MCACRGVKRALGLHLRSLPPGRSFSRCRAPFEKPKKKAAGYAKDVPDEARIRRRTSSDVDFRKTVFIYIVVFPPSGLYRKSRMSCQPQSSPDGRLPKGFPELIESFWNDWTTFSRTQAAHC